MTITQTTSDTTEELVFNEAEANARGIFIEPDDAAADHPLLRGARVGDYEFPDIDAAAWAA